ncbi:MAG: GNAT family N-acetyltransferase [Haliscomenobacteraceae bacterium CHB4]|nr:GNAT family N-acetyltransferase [Haliscomenobacteraceae bacterium CHB4]
MFLRAYRHDDKRQLQQLFYDTVHTVNARDHSPEQINAWAPAEPDREVWARLDQQYSFVVAFQKTIVGFISLTNKGEIDFLYVHKDFQGKGIASALLKQVERLARKRGISVLYAAASATARGFFENNGFVTLAEQRLMLRGTEIANFKMEKRLPLPAQ